MHKTINDQQPLAELQQKAARAYAGVKRLMETTSEGREVFFGTLYPQELGEKIFKTRKNRGSAAPRKPHGLEVPTAFLNNMVIISKKPGAKIEFAPDLFIKDSVDSKGKKMPIERNEKHDMINPVTDEVVGYAFSGSMHLPPSDRQEVVLDALEAFAKREAQYSESKHIIEVFSRAREAMAALREAEGRQR